MNNNIDKLCVPLFLRSLEEVKFKKKEVEEINHCYSRKYQGYCIFKRPNRWRSVAIISEKTNNHK